MKITRDEAKWLASFFHEMPTDIHSLTEGSKVNGYQLLAKLDLIGQGSHKHKKNCTCEACVPLEFS